MKKPQQKTVRIKVWRQSKPSSKTQCAGQECGIRHGCERFMERRPGAPWASFDIERQYFGGACPNFLEIEQ